MPSGGWHVIEGCAGLDLGSGVEIGGLVDGLMDVVRWPVMMFLDVFLRGDMERRKFSSGIFLPK
jgi:hypothetical protein